MPEGKSEYEPITDVFEARAVLEERRINTCDDHRSAVEIANLLLRTGSTVVEQEVTVIDGNQ